MWVTDRGFGGGFGVGFGGFCGFGLAFALYFADPAGFEVVSVL